MKRGPFRFQWACLVSNARSMASARRAFNNSIAAVLVLDCRSFLVWCMEAVSFRSTEHEGAYDATINEIATRLNGLSPLAPGPLRGCSAGLVERAGRLIA